MGIIDNLNVPEAADKVLNGQGLKEFLKSTRSSPLAILAMLAFVSFSAIIFIGMGLFTWFIYNSRNDIHNVKTEVHALSYEVSGLRGEMKTGVNDTLQVLREIKSEIRYSKQ